MADQREVIINFLRYHGPVLPVQVAKHVNTNILFASAMLSELVSGKHLKMTKAAIGGSPLYYLAGQEALMDQRLSSSLGGREKEIYNLLKERKILREEDLEPWQRVAVKSLTDFAVPMSAKHNDGVESFWKHHLVSDDEAKQLISSALEEIYNNQQKVQEIVSNIETHNLAEIKIEDQAIQETVRKEPEIVKVEQKILSTSENKIPELEPKLAEKQNARIIKKIDPQFYSKVFNFMKENKVEILKEEIVKKNREFDFVVNIPTVFGRLKYLVKAKSKPSINEADISMAFSEGQIKKMPVIMLVDGKITKKASLLVEQKMQGQFVVKGL